jgi:hypothetical protein
MTSVPNKGPLKFKALSRKTTLNSWERGLKEETLRPTMNFITSGSSQRLKSD